ncbi:proton/sodium-glutamate symport protein [Waddlia chondrophila 2032/99]|uniref:Proton/sodium-glutamate symport protein n=1 Tax=Waddlia chondrophila 2032/99 TaxID=765953 RepID=F8LE21_9BACT|nr:proton/sodium-glutamate symport protein [Waddlia chondrophila 2032/99]
MFFKKLSRQSQSLAAAILLGLFAGYANHPTMDAAASVVSEIFINLLKLVSLPIIFLSIVSTASGMDSIDEIKSIGKKVIKYTLLTTVIAATFALIIFVTIDPVRSVVSKAPPVDLESGSLPGYMHYLINIIPSNIIQPFSDNSVIGVLFLAMLLSFAILSLPQEKRKLLNSFFSGLYAAIMKITTWIVQLMPFAIWAFITLFVKDVRSGMEMKSIALYLACVLIANLVQAFVVLPILLKIKKMSPVKIAWGMMPALSLAFFSKSSSAALPMAMKCAEERVSVSRKVASFSLPLCTTINMNACAAFILTTVLFVSMSNGITYTPAELVFWIFIATIAAVGNAGVPMGCYFISSAFLAAMNVPLNILGVILPFYAMIDMLETAINVWSDSCVTAIVQKEMDQEESAAAIVSAV